jgi:hypothetical protein
VPVSGVLLRIEWGKGVKPNANQVIDREDNDVSDVERDEDQNEGTEMNDEANVDDGKSRDVLDKCDQINDD